MNEHRLDREAENITGSIKVMDSLDDAIHIYADPEGRGQAAELQAAFDATKGTGRKVCIHGSIVIEGDVEIHRGRNERDV